MRLGRLQSRLARPAGIPAEGSAHRVLRRPYQPSSGIVAIAFTVGLEEIHEVLDLGALLGSERAQRLDEHLISACVHGITLPQLAMEINAPTVRRRPQKYAGLPVLAGVGVTVQGSRPGWNGMAVRSQGGRRERAGPGSGWRREPPQAARRAADSGQCAANAPRQQSLERLDGVGGGELFEQVVQVRGGLKTIIPQVLRKTVSKFRNLPC